MNTEGGLHFGKYQDRIVVRVRWSAFRRQPRFQAKACMVDETKTGTDWQTDELDAIVSDYFSMLDAELSGQNYVKSRHSEALRARIGRTHGSVEYKHQNISAVLNKLGLP